MENKKIKNIFSIGYRCNVDDMLNDMGLRKQSSPFSYMVIDCKTALNFIKNKFEDYVDNFLYVDNNRFHFKWCENIWGAHLFFNKKNLKEVKNIQINEWDSVCVHNHHDLRNPQIKLSIKNRCNRLLYILNKKPDTLLLFCIDKIAVNYEDTLQRIDLIDRFTNEYLCNFLFLIPILNYSEKPKLVKYSDRINIIYFKSFNEGNGTAYSDKRIKWDLIKNYINNLYKFELEEKMEL
tara:strand:+ start:985 stop:1692 length:708 start_codon:yes stop_codon:yes gene_type:complete